MIHTNSANRLLNSDSNNSPSKIQNIMNSPNFGNQQILLQSCFFYDSDRSQTPHGSNTRIRDFNIKYKSKESSPQIGIPKDNLHYYNNLYNQTKNNSKKKMQKRKKFKIVIMTML